MKNILKDKSLYKFWNKYAYEHVVSYDTVKLSMLRIKNSVRTVNFIMNNGNNVSEFIVEKL